MRTRMIVTAAAMLVVPVHGSAGAVTDVTAPPAAPRAGQVPTGSSQGDWTGWYGCWRAVMDEAGNGPLVCVLPGDEAMAVRIATIENGEITEETVVRADGVARPIEEGGCSGTELAHFSSDGRRVFTRAELTCASGLGRTSTGVLGMVSGDEWIDAQALTVNGQHAARAIRYREVTSYEVPDWIVAELPADQRLAQEVARLHAAVPLDIAAVIEASQALPAPALEALLAAGGHGFSLNARALDRLASNGVAASTIDVMIALSYPSRFAVGPRDIDRGAVDVYERGDAQAWVENCYDPYWMSYSRYGCGGRYGYGHSRGRYGYGYSPFGYDPYGWRYGSQPIVIITPPADPSEPPVRGSVVKGRGYTRGSAGSSGSATRRDDPPRTGASASNRGNSTSGSSTAAPSTNTGGSGSSQPATRTAKPRGN